MPLPKDDFTPPKSLLAMKDLMLIIHSNMTMYEFARGRLVYKVSDSQSQVERIQANQSAEKALRSKSPLVQIITSPARNGYRYVPIIIGISTLFLIVLVLRRRYGK
jgi:hypothetical protein